MQKHSNTPCVRCGKERIKSKTWQEHIGTSLVTYTLFVCPDKECQIAVDEDINRKKDHLAAIQAKSLERKKENKRNSKKSKKK